MAMAAAMIAKRPSFILQNKDLDSTRCRSERLSSWPSFILQNKDLDLRVHEHVLAILHGGPPLSSRTRIQTEYISTYGYCRQRGPPLSSRTRIQTAVDEYVLRILMALLYPLEQGFRHSFNAAILAFNGGPSFILQNKDLDTIVIAAQTFLMWPSFILQNKDLDTGCGSTKDDPALRPSFILQNKDLDGVKLALILLFVHGPPLSSRTRIQTAALYSPLVLSIGPSFILQNKDLDEFSDVALGTFRSVALLYPLEQGFRQDNNVSTYIFRGQGPPLSSRTRIQTQVAE